MSISLGWATFESKATIQHFNLQGAFQYGTSITKRIMAELFGLIICLGGRDFLDRNKRPKR